MTNTCKKKYKYCNKNDFVLHVIFQGCDPLYKGEKEKKRKEHSLIRIKVVCNKDALKRLINNMDKLSLECSN